MDASLRNTPALMNRIDKLYGDVIKHYEALVSLAAVENATDRNSTALAQYQMQVETTALTRAIEEGQSFTRQLQEMWLFGQLNTIGDSEAKQRSDEAAKELSRLLQQLADAQKADPDDETKMEA
ncbi:hypothetical protein KC332_g6554 [Hortaea werneckii]|uniref:Uncharacterized protein n=1 Tax=Hortaea werneckii TaxID=91943 RepID=A0A3M7IXW7_HORWE|nr:hypothetical protein KC350_g7830 [Hortaea werneckii]KAI6830279.1 hypothetical protein KC342_g8504 [Hortaea werneckii]KAI6832816.1 hypothetical protein KC358_g6242 [Hortaea werneckii]KAI6933254.1 hypothetical protein KC341_g8418 [Hortaea werneckii]KAI6934085.1 hypothetical protein KC348_g6603 [Hortaea werneckii]